MRPKKKILCVNSSEQELSILTFMLMTNGYAIRIAYSSKDAIEIFASEKIDLVLATIEMGIDEMAGVNLIKRLKQIIPFIPMALIDNGKLSIKDGVHDGVINRDCTPAGLLERIKVMTARKRGPKPGLKKLLDMKAQSEPTLSAGIN